MRIERAKKAHLVNKPKILKEVLYLIADFTLSIIHIVNPICHKDVSFRDSFDLATDLGCPIGNLME